VSAAEVAVNLANEEALAALARENQCGAG